MPANLPPPYHEAEARYRAASTSQDKIAALEEMLRLMPKHKGTDKLQADIKSRMAKLKRQPKKSAGTRTVSHHIPKEGGGASRNPKVRFGPPSYKEAAFSLRVARAVVPVRLRYP